MLFLNFSTFFKLTNLKGSTKSEDFVAIGMSNEVTADCFVRSIAKLHQKLSIIVHYFNFCYSLQVGARFLAILLFLIFICNDFLHFSLCWSQSHIVCMVFTQFLDCTLFSFQIIRTPSIWPICCIQFCH